MVLVCRRRVYSRHCICTKTVMIMPATNPTRIWRQLGSHLESPDCAGESGAGEEEACSNVVASPPGDFASRNTRQCLCTKSPGGAYLRLATKSSSTVAESVTLP